MPGPVLRNQLAFRIHVRLVILGVGVEEVHERTVRYEWHDPVGLVPKCLQATDPQQHHNQSDSGHSDTHSIRLRRQFEDLTHCYPPTEFFLSPPFLGGMARQQNSKNWQ
jgi:hypothetical protein